MTPKQQHLIADRAIRELEEVAANYANIRDRRMALNAEEAIVRLLSDFDFEHLLARLKRDFDPIPRVVRALMFLHQMAKQTTATTRNGHRPEFWIMLTERSMRMLAQRRVTIEAEAEARNILWHHDHSMRMAAAQLARQKREAR